MVGTSNPRPMAFIALLLGALVAVDGADCRENACDSACLALVQTNSTALRGGAAVRSLGQGSLLAWATDSGGVESSPAPAELRRRVAESALLAGLALICLALFSALLMRHGASTACAATQHWLELAIHFAGLVIAFGAYGVLQEFIMTQRYGESLFPSAAFLMLSNRIIIISVSAIYLLVMRESLVMPACRWAAIPAVTNSISSWCQHSSLRFITFPTQTVFKNSKIVPTMFMNGIMNDRTHSFSEYVIASVVTLCVIGFSMSSRDDGSEEIPTNTPVGVVIMVTFIICDAFTSTSEKRIYRDHPGFSNMQMMLAVAFFSLLYSVMIVHFTVGFSVVFAFLAEHPEALVDLGFLAVCSTIGQYLTYHVIRRHGPVTLSIMMTVRQVFSIYISALLFDHQLSWISNCCVFAGIVAVLAKPLLVDSSPAKGSGKGTAEILVMAKNGEPAFEVNKAEMYGTFSPK
jgi:adenosine 3'-phospho 5'-phosphosulfate transporter B2